MVRVWTDGAYLVNTIIFIYKEAFLMPKKEAFKLPIFWNLKCLNWDWLLFTCHNE